MSSSFRNVANPTGLLLTTVGRSCAVAAGYDGLVAVAGGLDRQGRLIRVLYLVVLLTGLVAMHSVVFATVGHSHAASHAASPVADVITDSHVHTDDTGAPCREAGGCDCMVHGAFHPCPFVLADAPTALPIGTFVWIGANLPLWRSQGLRLERRHSERAPPDEAPSLAQLSVLRI